MSVKVRAGTCFCSSFTIYAYCARILHFMVLIGDCDSDSDCKSGLYCYKRDPGESVPGCSGGSSSHSRK